MPPPPPADSASHDRRFRRRALALLAGMGLVGYVGYLLGHPLHPADSRLSRLASRAVRLPAHWVQGRFARADRHLTLTLDSAALRTLRTARAVGLQRGLLPEEAKIWVPATVQPDRAAPQTGKVRLKGDYPDHWRGPKWSLRVQLPPTAPPAWGMRLFSIQAPETREYLAEWLLHYLLRREGLAAIRYEFAQVTLNGHDKGIYAVEESFGPELVAANHRRGLLLKFDETELIDPAARPPQRATAPQDTILWYAPIEPFDKKRVLTDSVLAPQWRRARQLLAGVRAGTLPLHAAFDAAAAGRLYACCDLLGAHHAVRWKNSRFLYDAATDRLTLLAYDGNGAGRIGQAYPARWASHRLYVNDETYWKDRFFSDPIFQRAYLTEARRLSRPEFVRDLLASAEPQLTRYRRLLYRDYPTYDYDWLLESLTLNQAALHQYVATQTLSAPAAPRP